jgi:hypothetical protein
MSQDEFVTYKSFENKFEVEEIIEILEKNKIEFQVENFTNSGPLFSNIDINIEYKLKIRSKDFIVVDQLYIAFAEHQIKDFGNDYYLFDFENEELLDIIKNKDEWGVLDYSLALKILNERGVSIDTDKLEAIKIERLEELGKEQKDFKLLFFGYVFLILSVLELCFLKNIYFPIGSLLVGFVIGSIIGYSKVTLPNGERKFIYKKKYRLQGIVILILNLAISIGGLAGFFYLNMLNN